MKEDNLLWKISNKFKSTKFLRLIKEFGDEEMKKYCIQCGHELKEGNFCANCGKRVKLNTVEPIFTDGGCNGNEHEKLIFEYRASHVDLHELIDKYHNANEKITIKNAATKLKRICKIPYGLAKKVIKEAYHNGRVYEFDDKTVKTVQNKKGRSYCSIGLFWFDNYWIGVQ